MATKTDPRPLFVVLESYVNDLGVFRAGDRLRGDHPNVVAHPVLFVPDGLSTDEIHEVRQADSPAPAIYNQGDLIWKNP